MKEDIISHIQDNREVSRIYSELRAGFFAYNHITFPMIREEDREEIYKLVKEMENDTCRKILFGFYWQRHSMEALAELIGLNNADVAKSTKVRCFTKLRNAVLAVFRKKGLI